MNSNNDSKCKNQFVICNFNPKPFAKQLIETNLFLYDKYHRFWRYDKSKEIWVEDADQYIRTKLRKEIFADSDQKKHYIDEIVSYIRDSSWESDKDASQPKNIISFNNKLFNLDKGDFIPADPKIFVTSKIPVDIDDNNKDCPNIDRFLGQIVGEKYKTTLYEIIAYCLYRDYPYQKMFILYGKGNNGKSAYMNLILGLLGENNISCVTLQDLANPYNSFSRGSLWNKLANLSYDLSPTEIRDTSILKALTGGDYLECNRKYKNSFSFKNHAKFITGANELPGINDKTYAFYRRIFIIEFPYTFEGEKRDPFILKQLTTPEELSGLAWKCLNILKELKRNKFIFNNEPTIDEIEKSYDELSDPLSRFIREECTEDFNRKITKAEFNLRFKNWLKKEKLRQWNMRRINNAMREKFNECRLGFNNFLRGWEGIAINK